MDHKTTITRISTQFLVLCCCFFGVNAAAAPLPLALIKLPPGFKIAIYAQAPNARSMTLGPKGVVFVSSRAAGKVYALVPNKNLTHAKTIVIAQGLNQPNGVAFHNGDLYVAEIQSILRYPDIMPHLNNPPKPQQIAALPDKKWHGWRYLKFGPDGWLYVSIGVPCNTCLLKNPLFGTIVSMKPDGSDQHIFAKGVRNSVGFAWNPHNGVLWFTDNGQDFLGDNTPPDELNRAPKKGMDFGFPYFYGDNVPAPTYGKLRSSKGMTPPALKLQAHVAPLGITFYSGTLFPPKYANQIFIAEHGSWNRSKKVGYQVINVDIKKGRVVSHHVFAQGWLQGQDDWGRPVDVLVMPDGALLISDDKAGVIYRISYHKS